MKLKAKLELLKFCSSLLNFIFMVLGLSVAGCGLWILYDSNFISVMSSDSLRFVAAALLAVGGVVLVVAVLGLVGARRESRVLLLPVLVFLVVLVLAQLFITFLIIIKRHEVQTVLMETVDKLILQYPTGERHLLDNMQHYAKCCGRSGPSDWVENLSVKNLSQSVPGVLPCSCFRSRPVQNGSFCTENQTLDSDLVLFGNGSYSTGCEAALKQWLRENLLTIIAMDLGLVFIQVLQLVVVGNLFHIFGAKSSVKGSDLNRTEPDQDLDQVYSDQDLLHQDLDQVYSDQDLLHQDLDQGLHHGPYDGPYGEPYEQPYQDPDQDYRI